jgi:UDP-N-acetylglucosamine--N-acetylmuramyl-(pentapeptide) pyrophosphoryl-undecaprenol N-acetylglucosamine transferase
LGLADSDKFLVVIGGSQGARGSTGSCPRPIGRWSTGDGAILWQTGRRDLEAAREAACADAPGPGGGLRDRRLRRLRGGRPRLTRSGASTLAELALHGLPSVLVPFPSATGNHQEINAREFEVRGRGGGAVESGYYGGIAALRAVERSGTPLRRLPRHAVLRAAGLRERGSPTPWPKPREGRIR